MPKFKDMKLKEPEEEDIQGIKKKIGEIVELYDRAQKEHKTTREKEYWQGRKDGIRAALAILEPGEGLASWDMINKSSPGFRLTEKEALLEFLKDARYNVGAALWEYSERGDKRIHIQTIINLLQWLDSYDRRATRDEVYPAPDSITPSWRKLTGR